MSGTAIQTARCLRSEDIEEVALTNICPYSLGVGINRQGAFGIFSLIIERNTTMSMSCVETYSIMHLEQDPIMVNVYRGENCKVKNNILVELFDVPLKRTRVYQSIDIRFSYDINRLLEVDVLLEDGSVRPRVINHNPVTLSVQQIEESWTRLSALKIYPYDMFINHTFRAKPGELWARALSGKREETGRVITDFDAVLQSNDVARVDEVRRWTSDYLAIKIP